MYTASNVFIIMTFIIIVLYFFYFIRMKEKANFIFDNKIKIGFFSDATRRFTRQEYLNMNTLLKNLNNDAYSIAYGGGKDGIMGQVGELAIKNNFSLYAFNYTQFKDREYPEAHVTLYDDFISREKALINFTDIAIVLPGRDCTLMELFWLSSLNDNQKFNNKASKKIIVWNIDGYYDQLIHFLNSIEIVSIIICNTYQEILYNIV